MVTRDERDRFDLDRIEAAKVAQDTETHRVCEAILHQEIAMSDWLRQHLPELTQAFLRRSAAPETEAKR